jgi:hypothetical protein
VTPFTFRADRPRPSRRWPRSPCPGPRMTDCAAPDDVVRRCDHIARLPAPGCFPAATMRPGSR